MSLRQQIADAVYSRLPRARWLQAELALARAEIDRYHEQIADARAEGMKYAEQFRLLHAYHNATLSQQLLQHRSYDDLKCVLIQTNATTAVSPTLVTRIRRAYMTASNQPPDTSDSFWLRDYAELKSDIHHKIVESDGATAAILVDPFATDLCHGFDNAASAYTDMPPALLGWQANFIYDGLLRLAEAMGVIPMACKETAKKAPLPTVDSLLDLLDAELGFTIDFPNPFPHEFGILTPRGIASYRAVQALYQAWRIKQLSSGGPVVEIGAGLGRTAYYAAKLGLTDYTIVDLPMSSVAQAGFLGVVLGADHITLCGEERQSPIKIIPPAVFLQSLRKYDIAANIDSLTEMSRETATAYISAISERCGTFLSINHEANLFSVNAITEMYHSRRSMRAPYWMRNGYAEEVFCFR